MAKIIILGTANAVANEDHENTHLLIQHDKRLILVDCVSSPIPRLTRAGVNQDQVTDLLLTHFHPDHVSGTPLLLMDMWLLGRTKPLVVHGLEHTLSRLRTMMGLYDWTLWPDFFPVEFNELREEEHYPVIEDADLSIFASPGRHLVPTIGIRIEIPSRGVSAAYSSDTEPCDAILRLAKRADILIHESSGLSKGHSSARQAGDIARQSGARSLYLIHYPAQIAPDELLNAAQETYSGPVHIAQDFMEIEL